MVIRKQMAEKEQVGCSRSFGASSRTEVGGASSSSAFDNRNRNEKNTLAKDDSLSGTPTIRVGWDLHEWMEKIESKSQSPIDEMKNLADSWGKRAQPSKTQTLVQEQQEKKIMYF